VSVIGITRWEEVRKEGKKGRGIRDEEDERRKWIRQRAGSFRARSEDLKSAE